MPNPLTNNIKGLGTNRKIIDMVVKKICSL